MDSEAVVVDSEARGRGLVRLVGYAVQSYDGTPLGKVCVWSLPCLSLQILSTRAHIGALPHLSGRGANAACAML